MTLRHRQIALTRQERQALEAFKTQLLHKFDGGVARLFLYGSKARGESHRGSDLDVMVVLRRPDRQSSDAVYDLSFDIAVRYGVPLSVHVYTWREFLRYWRLPSSFMTNVAAEAVSLL